MSFWDDVEDFAGDVVDAVEDVAEAAAKAAEAAAKAAAEAAEAAAEAAANAARAAAEAAARAAEALAEAIASAAEDVKDTAIDVAEHGWDTLENLVKDLGHVAIELGDKLAHDGIDAAEAIGEGIGKLGHEALETISGLGDAIGNGATTLGEGAFRLWKDIGSTIEDVGSDLVDTGGELLDDAGNGFKHLVTGDFEAAWEDAKEFGADVGDGVKHLAEDVAQGALHVGRDVVEVAIGLDKAVIEGFAALGEGALDMAGTALGTGGRVARDVEHAIGATANAGVDAVVIIADAETHLVTDPIEIVGHAIGGPIGDFAADIAHGYGEAITTTVDHVGAAAHDGITGLTDASGGLMDAYGRGADKIAHDTGSVIDHLGRGDLEGAASALGDLGSDVADAAENIHAAQVRGAEALASAATDLGVMLAGLEEAMGKAGSAFVVAVGDSIGGDAGDAIADFGTWVSEHTELVNDLIHGDVEQAARDGADALGDVIGKWAGDEVREAAHSLADDVGGFLGDGIRDFGDVAADEVSGWAKDAPASGLEGLLGGGSSDQDSTGGESLLDHGWHGIESLLGEGTKQADDAVSDLLARPEVLLDQAVDLALDHASDLLGALTTPGSAEPAPTVPTVTIDLSSVLTSYASDSHHAWLH